MKGWEKGKDNHSKVLSKTSAFDPCQKTQPGLFQFMSILDIHAMC